jgi:hypothetical protein
MSKRFGRKKDLSHYYESNGGYSHYNDWVKELPNTDTALVIYMETAELLKDLGISVSGDSLPSWYNKYKLYVDGDNIQVCYQNRDSYVDDRYFVYVTSKRKHATDMSETSNVIGINTSHETRMKKIFKIMSIFSCKIFSTLDNAGLIPYNERDEWRGVK